MGVEKMSVSFELELGQAIRESAQHREQSVSAWLAQAAAERLRSEALGEAIAEWESSYGPLNEDDVAAAERMLARAATKRHRRGAA
jgi:hypothetical protein